MFQKPLKNKSIFNIKASKANVFISPKHTLDELIERSKLKPNFEEEKLMEYNEKMRFPSISNYLTRVNKEFDLSRSDGFKGFKMVLRPERRSFEELPKVDANNHPSKNPVLEKEMQELIKFKEEIGFLFYLFIYF